MRRLRDRVENRPGRPGCGWEGSDSDGGSSANEYAEGLGCADRKRCRERPGSAFEFDSHPREEFFEEPASYRDGESDRAVGSGSAASAAGLAAAERAEAAGLLARLERREEQQEADRGDRVGPQLAAVARRCEHRANVRPMLPLMQSGSRGEASGTPELAVPGGGKLATLRTHCAKLAAIRGRSPGGAAASATDQRAVAAVLEALEGLTMDVGLLKNSGIGRELNRKEWRWRAEVDLPAQKRPRSGGA